MSSPCQLLRVLEELPVCQALEILLKAELVHVGQRLFGSIEVVTTQVHERQHPFGHLLGPEREHLDVAVAIVGVDARLSEVPLIRMCREVSPVFWMGTKKNRWALVRA